MALAYSKIDEDGNMSWYVSTGPTEEPITVTELKTFARIDGTTEDTYLTSLIEGVREAAEKFLGRALIEQTIVATLDFWPEKNSIGLPQPPLMAITKIEMLDEDDVATEYDSDNYYAVTEAIPGEVVIKQSVTAPQNTARDRAGIKITFTAGYGSGASDVPNGIKQGLLIWATAVYEGRAMAGDPPPEAKKILDLFRVKRIN